MLLMSRICVCACPSGFLQAASRRSVQSEEAAVQQSEEQIHLAVWCWTQTAKPALHVQPTAQVRTLSHMYTLNSVSSVPVKIYVYQFTFVMLMATGFLILTHRGEMSDRISQQDVLVLRYMYTKAISDKKQPSAFGGQCK